MCDGYTLMEILCQDPQEEALGLDSRGWRLIQRLFGEDED